MKFCLIHEICSAYLQSEKKRSILEKENCIQEYMNEDVPRHYCLWNIFLTSVSEEER